MNRDAQPSLAETARLLAELQAALTGASGFKALLRRFGDLMGSRFGVRKVGFARISGKSRKLTLKRRNVRAGAIDVLDDAAIAAIGEALAANDPNARLTELKDGFAAFDAGGEVFAMTVIDDPQAREGCLVVWSPVAEDAAELVELVVKSMQNEARWYRKLEKAQSLLYRDDLTGLYNQRYLEIVLDAELRRADRFQTQFCLLFIDMDGFKPINDNHGHLSGSSCLRQVADVIRDAVREVDVPIRYGGDEFVVILLGASCSKGSLAAERVRKRIEQKDFVLDGGVIAHLTASIGVAAYPDHGKDRDTLLKMADETMYDSKKNGKNRVTIVGSREGGT